MDVYTVSGVGPASLTMRRLPLDADNLKQEVQQMDDNKSKALAAALSQIEKQFGKGSIMRMDDAAIKDIDIVSTGSLGLDLALGVGGLPRGRVVEIYGPESSRKTTLTLQFINQIRMKIGVMFGNPETTTGGNALKFYASVRMDIRRIGSIKKGDEVIGSETRVKVVKNKVAPPFRQAEFDILYGEGISREGEVLEIGVIHGVLEKSGAWYIYNTDRLGQGKDNARDFLKENPQLAREIEAKIREKAGIAKPAPAAAEPAEEKKVEHLATRKRG